MGLEQREPFEDDASSRPDRPREVWKAPSVRRFPAVGAEANPGNQNDGDSFKS